MQRYSCTDLCCRKADHLLSPSSSSRTQDGTIETAKGFSRCSYRSGTMQAQGTVKNYKPYNDLRIVTNCRSVSVAMAGRARGAICAVLDLLDTFGAMPKVS